jgi:hypothetical protein
MAAGHSRGRQGLGRSSRVLPCQAGEQDKELDQLLQEDLRRLQSKEQSKRVDPSGNGISSTSASSASLPPPPQSSLKELVDKALIADFFFILFALGWLGAGVGLKSATGVTSVLDAWLALWQWVFQPAIGVLMLGALVSGGIGWIREKTNAEGK